jgi:hypothetical protein
MKTEIEWDEWLDMVRRIGRLEGAIEAHKILTRGNQRIEDRILYQHIEETPDA